MTEVKKNKMAEKPIGSLLFTMSIPAIFSMMIQAMYNIVDTIYISRLSEDAVVTLSLVFPMQIILISLALGGAIGASTLIARRLGQGNYEEANKTASTGVLLAIFHSIICALIGLFLTKPFLSMFTSNPEIIEMGYSYLSIAMIFSIGVCISIYFERILQAQGNMILPMCSLMIGALTNILLDPIFIFGNDFVPAMGIKGAAIATVIGQMAAMVFISTCMIVGKYEVKLQFKGLKIKWSRIKEIYAIGIPVIVMNAIGAFANTAVNGVITSYSEAAVAALGFYFKLSSFVFMPVFGLNQGALPILSFTFGSKNKERYFKTVKLYLFTVLIIMVVGTVIFWFQTDLIMSIFEVSDTLLAITRHALRSISLSFVFFGISIVLITIFQSLGKAFISMVMSILRQVVFLVPLAYLFGKIGGVDMIWYAYFVGECLVIGMFIPQCYKLMKSSFKEDIVYE